MYNGYKDQDAFHEALQARWADTIAERERRITEDPESFRHEGCDHAYGICAG